MHCRGLEFYGFPILNITLYRWYNISHFVLADYNTQSYGPSARLAGDGTPTP